MALYDQAPVCRAPSTPNINPEKKDKWILCSGQNIIIIYHSCRGRSVFTPVCRLEGRFICVQD